MVCLFGDFEHRKGLLGEVGRIDRLKLSPQVMLSTRTFDMRPKVCFGPRSLPLLP